MHILIAPNSFKQSLSARKAAKAIERGLAKSGLDCSTELFPIADGGNGTRKLIHHQLNGVSVSKEVNDPLGRPVNAEFSLIEDGKTAVIEMAEASGIHLLADTERNPLETSSTGTGELIKAALDKGVNRLILGMGGSATVDGGCGILQALGVQFLNSRGTLLKPIPRELIHLDRILTDNLDKRLKKVNLIILCDVKNKLLGNQGAAKVFGPQKGASSEDIVILEDFLKNFSEKTHQLTGRSISGLSSGGVAGGASAGLYAFTGAKLVNGIDYFLNLTHFEDSLREAAYVITGEGSLDEQTLSGKGPYGVAQLAKRYNIPCIGLAGSIPKNPSSGLKTLFKQLISINPPGISLREAIAKTEIHLEKAAEKLGKELDR